MNRTEPGNEAAALAIGGLAPLTTVDFPGRLSAVVFCQGCGWRCPYCHNQHLLRRGPGSLSWDTLRAFLEARAGFLDGVVFSGGEPLIQPAIEAAITEVRALGFAVALHTGGPAPERLRRVLPRTAWVGFDVKAPFADYACVTGVRESGGPVRESLATLIESGIDHEVRTTVYPPLIGIDGLTRLADELTALGIRRWVLQEYRPQGVPAADRRASMSSPLDDEAFMAELKRRIPTLGIRRAVAGKT